MLEVSIGIDPAPQYTAVVCVNSASGSVLDFDCFHNDNPIMKCDISLKVLPELNKLTIKTKMFVTQCLLRYSVNAVNMEFPITHSSNTRTFLAQWMLCGMIYSAVNPLVQVNYLTPDDVKKMSGNCKNDKQAIILAAIRYGFRELQVYSKFKTKTVNDHAKHDLADAYMAALCNLKHLV
jgi:Holliday junction resolvasome RuvABC endonuclease subunit